MYYLRGSLAQLVEQRPEEPCVPSSSLGGATNIFVRMLFNINKFTVANIKYYLTNRATASLKSAGKTKTVF
jgi:hypothetical protein